MKQLALFGDDQIVGTGRPYPWPKPVEAEAESADVNPDQLAFDDEMEEAA